MKILRNLELNSFPTTVINWFILKIILHINLSFSVKGEVWYCQSVFLPEGHGSPVSGCLRGVPRPGHWLEGGQATGCQATGGQAHRPVRGPGGGGRGGAHLGASQEEAGIGMRGQGA